VRASAGTEMAVAAVAASAAAVVNFFRVFMLLVLPFR
jgi:hypothetical protein